MASTTIKQLANAVRMELGKGGWNLNDERSLAYQIAIASLNTDTINAFATVLLHLGVDAAFAVFSMFAPLPGMKGFLTPLLLKITNGELKVYTAAKLQRTGLSWEAAGLEVIASLVSSALPSGNPFPIADPFDRGDIFKKGVETLKEMSTDVETFVYPQELPQEYAEDTYCGAGSRWTFVHHKKTHKFSAICFGRVPCDVNPLPVPLRQWKYADSDNRLRDFAIRIEGTFQGRSKVSRFKSTFIPISHYRHGILERCNKRAQQSQR